MKNVNPLVTVLLPVYNGEKYIRESIQSVLNQTFINFELLIINDGSTDKTVEIINSFKDKRINLLHNQQNLKLIRTLNKGIDLAKGKYIARMDADDISLPMRIEKQVAFMESEPDVGLCGTWTKGIDENGSNLKYGHTKYAVLHDEIFLNQLVHIQFVHGSCMIRKGTLIENELKYDPDIMHAEDYDLWTRMQSQTKLANLSEFLVKYRIHNDSVSQVYSKEQEQNSIKVRKKLCKSLDLETSEVELNTITNAFYQNYKMVNLDILEQFLVKLIRVDKHSVISRNSINTFSFNHWFNTCYNLNHRKLFYNSVISKKGRLSFIQSLKFLLKSIFK